MFENLQNKIAGIFDKLKGKGVIDNDTLSYALREIRVALLESDSIPTSTYQKTEVSKVEWKTFDSVCNIIRPYNLEKMDVVKRVNTLLSEYRLY